MEEFSDSVSYKEMGINRELFQENLTFQGLVQC